jgi:NAD(P)-dependent dehydrogenase (short-subunit alcohol dehydrogenase family)
MTGLEGRVAVVTGGSSGIGFAVARALGAAGAAVVLGARHRERGAAAAAALADEGIDVLFLACDVRSPSSVAALVAGAVDARGGLDIMVNNAGVEGPISALHEYPDEALRDVVDTNFAGVALGMKYALPALLARGGGTIINMSSTIGTIVPFGGGVVYGGTKAAIVSMTAAVAAAYSEHGIRAFALQPWITDTPMIDRLTGGSPDARAGLTAMNPSGQIVDPAEIGSAVLRLVVAGNGVNGSVLVIDAAQLTAIA